MPPGSANNEEMADRSLHEKTVSGRAAVNLPPSPLPKASVTSPLSYKHKKAAPNKQTGKPTRDGGLSEHTHSALKIAQDLHHIHDVHMDHNAVKHDGLASGEDKGVVWEEVERNAMRKIGWGKQARKAEWGEEEFNLDTRQLKRLQEIMDRVRIRQKQVSKLGSLFRAADRKAYRMERLQELVVSSNARFRADRVVQSGCSEAMRFCIVGDDVRLRQELEVYGKKIVDKRDMRWGGHTLLHEAVGRGHLHIVSMLLSDFHANPNVATLLGWSSPLHMAVERDLRQIAAYLIAFGGNLRGLDSYGRIPFHLVKSVSVMKLLLKYKHLFEVDTKSAEGLYPSQHYDKYCAEEEKIPPLVLMLQQAENKASRDRAREEREAEEDAYNRAQGIVADFPLAISQNSTLVDTHGNKETGKKNAYRLVAQAKEKERQNIEDKNNSSGKKSTGGSLASSTSASGRS